MGAIRKLRLQIVRLFASQDLSGSTFLLVLAVFVGLGGGLGAVGFRWLIDFFNGVLLGQMAGLLGHRYLLPLVPATGGLLVGILVLRWAREARGHGVPEVMAAVATQDGRIRPRVVIIKALASAICIGSGGSVGREGPIVQIGSALGSSVGQLFGLSRDQLKILVGCGAAAGISATFNAPIAGVLFALEVILGDFSINTFSPIILSSVLATAVTRHLIGSETAFSVPAYELVSFYELPYYAGLALLAAFAAVGFSRMLYWMEDVFEDLPISDYVKPVIGGAVVGGIGIFYPQVFGVGYDAITQTLCNQSELSTIAVLFVAKILATSFTLGSGGSGGIFAPSLFIGAMLGGAYGYAVHALSPGITAQPGAYALVGMGAMVAGTTHAPLTAMLILFELTDDYQIILPLMLATVICTLVAKRLYRDSIYTLKLSRRGLRIAQGIDLSILDSIFVRDVMNREYDFVKAQTPLGEIVTLLQHSEFTDFPVVEADGVLRGVVSFQDIRSVMREHEIYSLIIAEDVIGGEPPSVQADATLSQALTVFSACEVDNLPVVDTQENRRLVGVITRSNLMAHYHQELQKRADL